MRIEYFDIWQPGYGGATVTVYLAGTTTKASLFSDEALTSAVPNPQTLDSQTINSISYGKFSAPVYVGAAHYLDIDSTDQTGVDRPPITSLSGQDASAATVLATGGNAAHTLADILARTVSVLDYGEFLPTSDPNDSPATNTTTLTSAIGVASANGGGNVSLPDGTFEITQVNLPAGVILVGQGHETTVLLSTTADKIITISGDEAGLSHMTLDGSSLVVGSVGVYYKAVDEVIFESVVIKRFETGIHAQGGRKAEWRDLYISTCTDGAKLHGDNDAGGGADGDEFRHNAWAGGKVDYCTNTGVELSYVDKKCWHNTITDVGFEDNTGTALNINGARWTNLCGCWWSGNTVNLAVDDDDDTDATDENTVIGLFLHGGSIETGTFTLAGECQDIILSRMQISDVAFTLTLPQHAVLLVDCIEDSLVSVAGDGTKIIRSRSTKAGASSGTTSGATVTKAWSIILDPGQVAYLDARIIGNQRDGTDVCVYHRVAKVERPGSTLDYDSQTANFTLGEILTGTTSGATARIIADSDSGTSGTLTLRDIDGVFENNEPLTDSASGAADANGVLSHNNCAILQADTIGTDYEDAVGLTAAFAANAEEIELQVTGIAAQTFEWLVDVRGTTT